MCIQMIVLYAILTTHTRNMTPEDVLRQIELLEEAGIQYLIVDLDPSREVEALDMFANEIIKKS